MEKEKRFPLGVVVISVVFFFAAAGTIIYWILRWTGRPVAETLPVGPAVYRAFAYPDTALSILQVVAAVGLLRLRKFGWTIALLGLGMWLSDNLLLVGLTGWSRIGFLGPVLLFILFSAAYLWRKRDLFR